MSISAADACVMCLRRLRGVPQAAARLQRSVRAVGVPH